jgi:pSer/pThr/pTyr-binding forkhead associated (FHA) protein
VVVAPAEVAGTRHTLTGAELTVGRGGGCSVVLDDSFVSQVHARLYLSDGRWVVEDLDSTNGTWVNADRVAGSRVLSVGDHLAMGSIVMELR